MQLQKMEKQTFENISLGEQYTSYYLHNFTNLLRLGQLKGVSDVSACGKGATKNTGDM